MLNRLKVGQKILAAESLVAIVLCVLLAISYNSSRELKSSLDEVKDKGVPNALIAKDMQMQVVQIQQWLTDISATRGQDGLDDGFREAEKAHKIFLNDLEKIRASYVAEKDSAGIKQADLLKQQMEVWYATGQKMANAYIDKGAPGGNQIMGEFDTVSTKLQQTLEPIIDSQIGEATKGIEDAVSEANKVLIVTVTGVGLVLAILLATWLLLVNSIGAPLSRMSALIAQMVSDKNFSVQLDVIGQDEIASVSKSFNDLTASLRIILREIEQGVRKLDETTTALVESVERSAGSSLETNDSTSAMASAVEQLSTSLDRIHENTHIALEVVREARQYSKDGGKTIIEAVDDIHKISAAMQDVSEVITTLGEQTSHISNIVQVIKEVADQTNLLALNAAIEAARAGEQGRGFAVVADEVRKLAERTTAATGEIANTILAIQQSSESAVEKMHHALDEANIGAELATKAGQAITAIDNSTDKVAGVFQEISSGIAEESVAGQLIAQKVEQVARASDENSLAVKRTAAAAKDLEALAHSMRQNTSQFKV